MAKTSMVTEFDIKLDMYKVLKATVTVVLEAREHLPNSENMGFALDHAASTFHDKVVDRYKNPPPKPPMNERPEHPKEVVQLVPLGDAS